MKYGLEFKVKSSYCAMQEHTECFHDTISNNWGNSIMKNEIKNSISSFYKYISSTTDCKESTNQLKIIYDA